MKVIKFLCAAKLHMEKQSEQKIESQFWMQEMMRNFYESAP